MKKIIFFMIVCIVSILSVSAASNPYKETGPYGTNCTWYAWKMAYEKAGISLPGLGDAKNWYINAQNKGYSVGTTAKANSIIIWGDWTSYGHVGYVERVEGNILYVWDSTGPCIDREDPEFIECMANGVSEESDKICYANAKRIACEYTISPSDYVITGYIYLDELPKTPVTSQTTSDVNKEEVSVNEAITKSKNAYLSSLELSNGLIEFDKNIFEYKVSVDYEIEKITIKATSEDSKAMISGAGDYILNVGLNEIKIIVKAEDASTKEYTIKITRNNEITKEIEEDSNEKEETIKKDDLELKTKIVASIGFLIIMSITLVIGCKYKKNKRS